MMLQFRIVHQALAMNVLQTMLVGSRTFAEALAFYPLVKCPASWIRILGKIVKKSRRQGVNDFEDFGIQLLVRQRFDPSLLRRHPAVA